MPINNKLIFCSVKPLHGFFHQLNNNGEKYCQFYFAARDSYVVNLDVIVIFGYKGSVIFGYKGSVIFGYKGSVIFGCKGSVIFVYKGSVIFGCKGSVIFGCKGSVIFEVSDRRSIALSTLDRQLIDLPLVVN